MAKPDSVVTDPDLKTDEKTKCRRPRRYNVVLLDDDDHTYEYVIQMLSKLFRFPDERGFQVACEVDSVGRAVLITTYREFGELKQEQIHGFGADPLIPRCKGSMRAVLEPIDED